MSFTLNKFMKLKFANTYWSKIFEQKNKKQNYITYILIAILDKRKISHSNKLIM